MRIYTHTQVHTHTYILYIYYVDILKDEQTRLWIAIFHLGARVFS